jgi:hypothetical protein
MKEARNTIATALARGKRPVTKDYLERLFTYNPETGDLIWNRRPLSDFKTLRGWGTWNAQNAGMVAGAKTTTKKGTPKKIQIRIDGIVHAAHRLIYVMLDLDLPDRMEIDHRNRNPFDNRIENLRLSTSAQNKWNFGKRKKNNLPKGVSRRRTKKKPFFACISVNRKMHCSPCRETPEEAGKDYEKLCLELHGEFACLE